MYLMPCVPLPPIPPSPGSCELLHPRKSGRDVGGKYYADSQRVTVVVSPGINLGYLHSSCCCCGMSAGTGSSCCVWGTGSSMSCGRVRCEWSESPGLQTGGPQGPQAMRTIETGIGGAFLEPQQPEPTLESTPTLKHNS